MTDDKLHEADNIIRALLTALETANAALGRGGEFKDAPAEVRKLVTIARDFVCRRMVL